MVGNHRPASSRLGGLGGDVLEVHGGRIVRSTGRKDRHSKVSTARGPRDRRVRLSAHTAIQFYDVQDRLGYDRPSKAVDWLMRKAKNSIDGLAKIPGSNPLVPAATQQEDRNHREPVLEENHGGREVRSAGTATEGDGVALGQILQNGTDGSGFLSQFLDSEPISETAATTVAPSTSIAASSTWMQFQCYSPPPPDLLSRITSSHGQDLRLSLQSFANSTLLHRPSQNHHHNLPALFSAAPASLGFDATAAAARAGWFDPQRMVDWHAAGMDASVADGGGDGGGITFAPPLPLPVLQPLFGQGGYFCSQRGPLQSSNTPSIRAWFDPSIFASATESHPYQQTPAAMPNIPSSISEIGFSSGGYSGFQIPARIRGEEEHDGVPYRLSSASSNPRR